MGLTHPTTVPLSMLRGLFGVVERRGVPRATLMAAASIGAEELEPEDARLSRDRFIHACSVAIELTRDEGLGVYWASLMTERTFGPISDGLGHAATLRQAFLLLARFEKFFTSEASFQVLEIGDYARLRVPTANNRPLPVRRLLAELGIAWHLKLLVSAGCDRGATTVAFAHQAPAYADAYAALFGTAVRFAQPYAEVVFPRVLLDVPRRSPADLSGTAQRPRHDVAPHPSCSERLLQLLTERAPSRLSMPEAARLLGLGERSMRRRLTAEGHSFKQLEFLALADTAKQLFVEGRTIEQTSHAMGFSRTSAFHRAFKRWTGRTPNDVQSDALNGARR